MEEQIAAFVDESGDESLSKLGDGSTMLFSAAGVLVNEPMVDDLRARVLSVEEVNAGGKKLKSSDIGGNDVRRLKIISEIAQGDFTYIAWVVNKAQLDADSGLRFKKSFRKNMASRLVAKMGRSLSTKVITFDGHGSNEFETEFLAYMKRKFDTNLFHAFDFLIASDDDEPLLRLADWIAGTWRKLLEDSISAEYRSRIRAALRRRELAIDYWPPPRREIPIINVPSENIDQALRETMLGRVWELIDEWKGSDDPMTLFRSAALMRLVIEQECESVDSRSYVISARLIHELMKEGYPDCSIQKFRSEVIAPIRESGVIIAGSTEGLRIATCLQDVVDYVEHVSVVVEPMMTRLHVALKELKLIAGHDLPELGSPKYSRLFAMLDAHSDAILGL